MCFHLVGCGVLFLKIIRRGNGLPRTAFWPNEALEVESSIAAAMNGVVYGSQPGSERPKALAPEGEGGTGSGGGGLMGSLLMAAAVVVVVVMMIPKSTCKGVHLHAAAASHGE